MTFKFYHYSSNRLNVDKSTLLGTALTITDAHIAGNQDIEHPVIVVSDSGANAASGYNYVYIQDWARYYFVNKRTWLADGALMLQLDEDYIFTAKSLIYSQNGFCRYSGLGNTNLTDSRVTYKTQPKIEKFPLAPIDPNDGDVRATAGYWYYVKFISENPFVSTNNVGNCSMNVAVMNSEGWRAFRNTYAALSEKQRVAVANCIQSVNKTMYGEPSTAGLANSTYGVRFSNPYAESGFDDVKVQWSMADYPDSKCVIITGADSEKLYLDPIFFLVMNSNMSAPQEFNTDSMFYKLNAQYFIKLADLQPIPFVPLTLGVTSSFRICLSIGYECFSENITIMFRKYDDTYHDYTTAIPHAPLVQRCQTTEAFLVDKALDLHANQETNNTLALMGGFCGGFVNAGLGIYNSEPMQAMNGVFSIFQAANNYEMRYIQQQLNEFIGMGLTGSVSGSLSWSNNYYATDGYCHVITQEPASLWNSFKGIPDGQWRLILNLVGTGYAEVDLVDVPGNTSGFNFTDNELTQIKAALSAGVIFNATSP